MMDPDSRGAALEASEKLTSLHLRQQEAGETDATAAEHTDTHFTCLLPWRGFVLELDGRKDKPILRSRIQPGQSFTEDTDVTNYSHCTIRFNNYPVLLLSLAHSAPKHSLPIST
ncbi:ubiquitin carboxyl-terminal hydrolase l3 [Cyclospora cayetanensis]|uniref:ubiquitinyl hydrolase 1 n=1 Tax=Cyclospora cayetanensis TaxID=88456 RepID=A0A1D3CVZ7_9EIME|nr:ubiquitin carboxyl-terminal hydrolase l3 [Cyclospora cayetanensis]